MVEQKFCPLSSRVCTGKECVLWDGCTDNCIVLLAFSVINSYYRKTK